MPSVRLAVEARMIFACQLRAATVPNAAMNTSRPTSAASSMMSRSAVLPRIWRSDCGTDRIWLPLDNRSNAEKSSVSASLSIGASLTMLRALSSVTFADSSLADTISTVSPGCMNAHITARVPDIGLAALPWREDDDEAMLRVERDRLGLTARQRRLDQQGERLDVGASPRREVNYLALLLFP